MSYAVTLLRTCNVASVCDALSAKNSSGLSHCILITARGGIVTSQDVCKDGKTRAMLPQLIASVRGKSRACSLLITMATSEPSRLVLTILSYRMRVRIHKQRHHVMCAVGAVRVGLLALFLLSH